MLQALNSIITSGELPTLFTEDELEGLLQVSKRIVAYGNFSVFVAMETNNAFGDEN